MKLTSRSTLVMGTVFGMSGIIYLVTGKPLLAGIWLFCSAIHFIEAYRLHCKEKEEP